MTYGISEDIAVYSVSIDVRLLSGYDIRNPRTSTTCTN